MWTDEGARRHDVALHPVPAPAVAVQGPGVTAAELPALLAAGGGVHIVDFFYTRCLTVGRSLGGSLALTPREPLGTRVRLLFCPEFLRQPTPEALS